MDANNLRCFFVKQAIDYLDCLKYSVTCCPDEAKKYYLLHKLSESDCPLTYDLQCLLDETKITNYYVDCNAGTYVEPVGCYDQIDVEIDIQPKTCEFTGLVQNPDNYLNTLPGITLANNSVYQTPSINVGMLNSCTGDTTLTTVFGSCDPNDCGDSKKAALFIGDTLTNTSTTPITNTSKLRSIVVYETDQFGQFVNSPIDLLVTDYLGDSPTCPGCTTINPDHLRFTDVNFVAAIATFFDNVSLARYGQTGKNQIKATKIFNSSGLAGVSFLSAVKHNPADNWMGFNAADFKLTYFPVPNVKPTLWYEVIPPGATYQFVDANFYSSGVNFTTTCGSTFTVTIPHQRAVLQVMGGTNFYRLVLSPITPIKMQGLNQPFKYNFTPVTCNTYQLKATVYNNATTASIASFNWYDGSNSILTPIAQDTNTKTVEVSQDGNYRVEVVLTNGCVIQYSVSLPEGTITQI